MPSPLLHTDRLARALGLICIAALLAHCGPSDDADIEPPSVPRLPEIERLEVNRFRVRWDPVTSDAFESSELGYEIGVVERDYCIVTQPDFQLTGIAEVEVEAGPGSGIEGPLVAFTARSVDPDGRSFGYGGCGWALRSPLRVPIQIPWNHPRAERLSCRGDGGTGAWCLGDGEIGYFRGGYWDIFTLPVDFEVADWLVLDSDDALVRSDDLQIHLSRSTGIHAYLLSSGNQLFDGDGGAIPTGRERGYVSVRGAVGEFSSYHIDLAGPARALRLPDTCDVVTQMGHVDEMAWALCHGEAGAALFLGEAERRTMRWEPPREVELERVLSVAGSRASGLAVGVHDDALSIITWEEGGDTRVTRLPVPGTGAIRAAATGTAFAPLVLAGRDDRFVVWRGDGPESVRVANGFFQWEGARVPVDASLVGVRLGILAISPDEVYRLSPASATGIQPPTGPLLARRGHDNRRYLFRRGSDFTGLLNSTDGNDWSQRLWRGASFEAFDIAVAPNGAAYVSGLAVDPAQPTGRTRSLRKLGEPDRELIPDDDRSFFEAPRIAVDELGRLFAVASQHVRWYTPSLDEWSDPLPLPLVVERVVGLTSGVLILGSRGDTQGLVRCDGDLCFPLTIPDAARRPIDTLFAHENGFCAGIRSRAIWCRQGGADHPEDEWIAIRFGSAVAATHGLGEADEWRVRDAVRTVEGGWLVAIETETDGVVAYVVDGEPARLVAVGLRWAEGDVLVGQRRGGAVVVIESSGPARLRIDNERVSVPGSLY